MKVKLVNYKHRSSQPATINEYSNQGVRGCSLRSAYEDSGRGHAAFLIIRVVLFSLVNFLVLTVYHQCYNGFQ
jgi:hypothetical protein